MKKAMLAIIAATAVIAAVCGIVSCEKYILPELELKPEGIEVDRLQHEVYVDVISNVIWNIDPASLKEDWLTIEPDGGEAGARVTIKIRENDSGQERSATVSFKSATIEKKLSVTQSAGMGE